MHVVMADNCINYHDAYVYHDRIVYDDGNDIMQIAYLTKPLCTNIVVSCTIQ